MNRFSASLLLCSAVLLAGCAVLQRDAAKQAQSGKVAKQQPSQPEPAKPYQPTPTKHMNLVHTKLELKPDWDKQFIYGQATLTFTPYFYPQDSLLIDAKGFDLDQVAIIQNSDKQSLDYTYDDRKINIDLPRTFQQKDTFRIFVDYTAKPRQLGKNGGSVAGNQGLYFINPQGKIAGKPRQIWTQGETNYSSCWFPTLDRPNEKTTQELYITVDTQFKTLSNGIKIYSVRNADGTRTDYWKQEKNHAPYLFMMAIGDFAIVKDEWRDSIPVNYYVEPEFKQYAQMIFGKSPEMMTFYSELFGYDYPWAKYSQVAVRDFIAGAMENTSATVHLEQIQQNRRGYQDRTFETLIAHELIHHWFGNLVTCESWANLSLNEAFATYGEYLWVEHTQGHAAASVEWQNNRAQYLFEARQKQVPLIQFRYNKKSRLFDAHRYQKGSCILHMLRAYLGDEAFFQGLQHYLDKQAYKPAEFHHLRLALEEISGRDLNWFFKQWFRSAGHPVLDIQNHYDAEAETVTYIVEQLQDTEQYPVFKLPLSVAVYQGKEQVTRHRITISEQTDTFRFQASSRPKLINFDAQRNILAEKHFHKSPDEWLFQYYNAPLYLDKFEATQGISRTMDSFSQNTLSQFFQDALNNEFWRIRKYGLVMLEDHGFQGMKADFREQIIRLAKEDAEPKVRAQAYQALRHFETNDALFAVYRHGLQDSAYSVVKQALNTLASINPEIALDEATNLQDTRSDRLLRTIASLYADHGNKEYNAFFRRILLEKPNWNGRFKVVDDYLHYLNRLGDDHLKQNLNVFRQLNQWIAGPNNRKKLIKALKQVRNEKQQELEQLKPTAAKQSGRDAPAKMEQDYAAKANLVEAMNQLINNLSR